MNELNMQPFSEYIDNELVNKIYNLSYLELGNWERFIYTPHHNMCQQQISVFIG